MSERAEYSFGGKNERKKTMCAKCNGSGLMKMQTVRCVSCAKLNIHGCIMCRSGYTTLPYEGCDECDSTGISRIIRID